MACNLGEQLIVFRSIVFQLGGWWSDGSCKGPTGDGATNLKGGAIGLRETSTSDGRATVVSDVPPTSFCFVLFLEVVRPGHHRRPGASDGLGLVDTSGAFVLQQDN